MCYQFSTFESNQYETSINSIKAFLALSFLTFFVFGCGEPPKSPEQLKQELLINELAEAKKYVEIENAKLTEDNHLFKADEVVITGTIRSTATVAKFKDVSYTVSFYSKTNTLIETRDFIVYEYLPPGGTLSINARMVPPKGYSKFNVKVKNVSAG